MAYKNNWLRHLFAFATGEGYSDTLARDFWHEDLWEPKMGIRWRWPKLVWAYSLSVLAQVTLPLLVGYAVISFFKEISLRWWLIGVGGVSTGGLIFAILFATAAYIDQDKQN